MALCSITTYIRYIFYWVLLEYFLMHCSKLCSLSEIYEQELMDLRRRLTLKSFLLLCPISNHWLRMLMKRPLIHAVRINYNVGIAFSDNQKSCTRLLWFMIECHSRAIQSNYRYVHSTHGQRCCLADLLYLYSTNPWSICVLVSFHIAIT